MAGEPKDAVVRGVPSRRWVLAINGLAASPLLSMRTRLRIYRRFGLDIEDATVFPRCYFHTNLVRVGAGALVNYGCHIENVAPVEIGSRTALGQFVKIITSTHEVGQHDTRAGTWGVLPVKIGQGCWIGASAVLLPGVTVGDGVVIAAGAVVRADCEPDGLYAGVPARRVAELDEPA
jgi:maltose O-acetyltransferase